MTIALAAATLTAGGQTVQPDGGDPIQAANLSFGALTDATTLHISGEWTAEQVNKLRTAITGLANPNAGINEKLTTVTFDPDAIMQNMKYLFLDCHVLDSVRMPTAVNNNPVDFAYTFSSCWKLKGTVDLRAFTAIQSLGQTFMGCSLLESILLPAQNTAPAKGDIIYYTFVNCNSLKTIDLSGFTAISDMTKAFQYCYALESVILPATENTKSLTFISLFEECKSLKTVDLSKFTNISSMTKTFKNCTSLEGVTLPATDNTTASFSFNSTFYGCPALKSVDLSRFPNIGNMTDAFNGCTALTSVKLGGTMPATTTGTFGNANPNCLVYAPAGWEAKPSDWDVLYAAGNTVVGDATLRADKPFRCPEAVTVAAGSRITYTRDFGTEPSGIGGNAAGWETISLPFTPTLVRSVNLVGDSITLVPFNTNSTYEGKGTDGIVPFWLRSLTPDSYTPVTTIEPDKPYIISMPNHTEYDAKFNVTGNVTFSATSTAEAPITIGVTPEALPSVAGSAYTLHSTYSTVPAAQSVYVINEAGTAFVANGGNALPFRPYVTANSPQNAPARFVIGEDEGGATAIEEAVLMGRSDGASADGLRVYGSNERGSLVVEAVASSTVDVVAIDGRVVRTVSLHEGVNVVNGLAAGVYVVGGQKAVVR